MDDGNWTFNYPQTVVSWLLNTMVNFKYSYDPMVIMAVEEKYPGLWDDILTERWYRDLIREQGKK